MSDIMRLPNGTAWPKPADEDLRHKVHYEPWTLTQQEGWRVSSILGAYDHLLDHPIGTEACLKTLRALRRALRAPDAGGEGT